MRRSPAFVMLAGVVALLDQVTKSIVRGSLAFGESWPSADWPVKLTHGSNSGAAFGMLQGQGAMLTVVGFVAIAAIFFYYAYPPLQAGLQRISLGLLLGGAVGNLADRLLRGEVTDFIDFPRYPDFNLADSAIVVGLAIMAGVVLLQPRQTSTADTPPGTPLPHEQDF